MLTHCVVKFQLYGFIFLVGAAISIPAQGDGINTLNHVSKDNLAPEATTTDDQKPVAASELNPGHQASSSFPTEVAGHLAQIESIEAEHGPYSDQLGENLQGLGDLYRQNGRLTDALEAYKRAQHIEKINAGLYSLGQINVLSKVIDCHIELGQWKAVGEKQNYLGWLYRRQSSIESQPPEYTETLLGIAGRLGQGHLNAYIDDIDTDPFYHLLNAQKLFKLSVRIIDQHYGALDTRMVSPLQGLSATSYYLNTYRTKSNLELNNSMFTANAKDDKRQINYEQITYNSYKTGRAALERISAIYQAQDLNSTHHQILTQVALADWEFLFNRKHSAMSLYEDAHDLIQQQDAMTQAEFQPIFDHPAMIPDQALQLALEGTTNRLKVVTPTDSSNENQASSTQTPYVLVRFDVSRLGEVRNIEFIDAYPKDTQKYKRDVRERLDLARFRPKFADGKAQSSYDIVKRYDFK